LPWCRFAAPGCLVFGGDSMAQYVLQMKNITKKFGGFTANDNISISLKKGEVLTLLGENGAGKSTLMNILCGLYKATEGSIFIEGEKVKISSPKDSAKYGIGMVHQHFMLVDTLTVLENIILGKSGNTDLFIDTKAIKKKMDQLSTKYGLNIDPDRKISQLSVGAQQRVEILKALWRNAEILILDEPTAVLTDEEATSLFEIIEKLTNDGKSVIFISHKMKEVLSISDRIVVLRAGQLIREFQRGEADGSELADLMVGRRMEESDYAKREIEGSVVFRVKNVSYNKQSKHSGLNNISIDVHKGEILGIAGVDGNGQSELAQLATGLLVPDEGEVYLKGERVTNFSAKYFIEAGVSHVPEDRNKMGLVGDMSITNNLILKSEEVPRFSKYAGWLTDAKSARAYAKEQQKKFDIRCASVDQETGELSGGNQQKVILARELSLNPELLVAAHPIRGLDVGAAQFIHDQIMMARDLDCAVLLISTDLSEVLLMSDRIVVMYEGKIMGVFDGINPPTSQISQALAGKEHGTSA